MKKYVVLSILVFLAFHLSAQTPNKYLGINLLQIPVLTPNINVSFESGPLFTPLVDFGYTPNYRKAINIDYIGLFLTPHCDCANDGYDIEKQAGAYIKFGSYFNLRRSIEKDNFFHLGIFMTNSIVKEEGQFNDMLENVNSTPLHVEHTKYLYGLALSAGYEFNITKRIKSNIDFQLSLPDKGYLDLYGYNNYIPGMGAKDFYGYWFPMLVWNLKYRL